jgi:electron transfer flavoprotein beta subunit
MKILVPISVVPDTTSKIAFTDGETKFNEDGIQWIVNPYDEWYALVRALEITEKDGGTVTVVSVGDATAEPVIRKALALGANDAVRIDVKPTESYVVAKELANYAKGQGFDMILLGKETINYNGSEVGGMLAEFLNLPYISLASKLEVNGGVATLERGIEGGSEDFRGENAFCGKCL